MNPYPNLLLNHLTRPVYLDAEDVDIEVEVEVEVEEASFVEDGVVAIWIE
jgi:hypothetical protein